MNQRIRNIVKLTIFLTILALIVLPNVSCSKIESRLSIFSAAGAKPAIDEIAQKYQDKYGIIVEVSYGGGGEVLNQMELSRSGNIYVAPEQSFMQTATVKEIIYPETIRTIAYMVPVIAVSKGNPKNIINLTDLAGPGVRVGVTRAETTLLGKFAPEIFAKASLTEGIGRNIVTEAVRPDSLVTALIMGQVDAGIVWHFYGSQSPDDIEIIYMEPEQLTGVGEMQIGASSFGADRKAAQKFIDFTVSSDGQAVFKNLGYLVDAGEVSKYWH